MRWVCPANHTVVDGDEHVLKLDPDNHGDCELTYSISPADPVPALGTRTCHRAVTLSISRADRLLAQILQGGDDVRVPGAATETAPAAHTTDRPPALH